MWAPRARALFEQIEPIANSIGLSVVDIDLPGRENGIFRIYVERLNGEAVSLDDCSSLSPIISDWLDTEELFPFRYTLEVSSPGLERPIRRWEHLSRFVGQTIKISTGVPIDNRRKITGVLKSVDNKKREFVVESDGKALIIAASIVKKMRIVYDFEENK